MTNMGEHKTTMERKHPQQDIRNTICPGVRLRRSTGSQHGINVVHQLYTIGSSELEQIEIHRQSTQSQ